MITITYKVYKSENDKNDDDVDDDFEVDDDDDSDDTNDVENYDDYTDQSILFFDHNILDCLPDFLRKNLRFFSHSKVWGFCKSSICLLFFTQSSYCC